MLEHLAFVLLRTYNSRNAYSKQAACIMVSLHVGYHDRRFQHNRHEYGMCSDNDCTDVHRTSGCNHIGQRHARQSFCRVGKTQKRPCCLTHFPKYHEKTIDVFDFAISDEDTTLISVLRQRGIYQRRRSLETRHLGFHQEIVKHIHWLFNFP